MIYSRKVNTIEAEQWNGDSYIEASELFRKLEVMDSPILDKGCIILKSKDGKFYMRAFNGDYIVKDGDSLYVAAKAYFEKEWEVK